MSNYFPSTEDMSAIVQHMQTPKEIMNINKGLINHRNGIMK